MFDPRIPQKNRSLAALLAFLVPGLGHYYQGRLFKASLYAICIIGTYTYGLAMADGNGVYTHQVNGTQSMRNFPFLAQAGFGSVGLVSIVQSQRYFGQDFQSQNIYPFEAGLNQQTLATITYNNPEEGVLKNIPGLVTFASNQEIGEAQGEFLTEIDGQQARFLLAEPSCNEPQLSAKETWTLDATVLEEVAGQVRPVGRLQAEIPRSFLDEFCMPPEVSTIDSWYNQVGGRRYDLAVTLTMIAGLLNLLAVWDCFDGPAHGYGDEQPEEKPEKTPDPKKEE
ncbi:MAG: hypothetical protein KDA65_04235 [Planctomycetaceae bacterium]|nr:hypothetical protein [Planctomycetaceae bacterium]